MSSITPITLSAAHMDGSPRINYTSTVVGSPATSAETIVASVTVPPGLDITDGILLVGQAAFTVGTSCTAVTAKIHQTNASGSTVYSTGATTATAGQLGTRSVVGFDPAPGVGTYVFTLTVANGAATSTVSAVTFVLVAI